MIDCLSGVGLGIGKKLVNHIGRHFLQQVNRIIRHQIVYYIRCFLLGKGIDDHLLIFHIQIGKYIRGKILGQNAIYLKYLGVFQFFHHRSNVCVILFRQKLSQLGILFCVQ